MGNKIATNYVIGTGEENIQSGVGGTGNRYPTLPTNIRFI